MMFKHYTESATVYRAWYTTESGYKKSGYVSTGISYLGHLKGQSIEKTLDLAMYGKIFKFTCPVTADIREADRLLISGVNYDVKGVTDFKGISFSSKQILLNKV